MATLDVLDVHDLRKTARIFEQEHSQKLNGAELIVRSGITDSGEPLFSIGWKAAHGDGVYGNWCQFAELPSGSQVDKLIAVLQFNANESIAALSLS